MTYHANRSNERVLVRVDLIGRNRHQVAARGAHVLDEGVHRNLRLLGDAPDLIVDHEGLNDLAAGAVDLETNGFRAVYTVPRKGPDTQSILIKVSS